MCLDREVVETRLRGMKAIEICRQGGKRRMGRGGRGWLLLRGVGLVGVCLRRISRLHASEGYVPIDV